VTSPALRTYLDGLTGDDVAAAPSLTALDAAIVAAGPALAVAVKYRMVMYAHPGDWRHWVCAISANRGGAALRFLYGVLLDDPLGVLRAGSSTLMTWDFAHDEEVPAGDVGRYVGDALARYDHFRANAKQIAADTKAALAADRERRSARR
jgi:hypothetical protein